MADIVTFPGLWLAPNQVSAPAGAMEVAENVYASADGRLVSRPGFDATTVTRQYPSLGLHRDPDTLHWGAVGASPPTDANLAGTVDRFDPATGAVSTPTLAYGPAWEPSYVSDPTVRDGIITANSRTYVSGRRGLHVVEKINGTWYQRLAGMPKGLAPLVPLVVPASGPGTSAGATGTNLNAANSWAYRTTIRMYLPDGTVHEGPPSERAILNNTLGTPIIPVIWMYFPPCTPIGGPYTVTICLWRSAQSPTTNGPPSDELYLVSETALSGPQGPDGFLVVTDGGSGTIIFNDIVTDGQLAVPLYTNAGAGSNPARWRPPKMSQVINFKGQGIGGRLEDATSASVTIYGTNSSGGLQNLTSIQVDGIAYTGTTGSWTPADEANQVFGIKTSANVPLNLQATAESLARAINGYYRTGAGRFLPVDRQLQAWAVNDGTDVGRVFIERPLPGGEAITITGLPAGDIRLEGAFSPVQPDVAPADIAWSETDDLESWPIENRQPLGNTTARLLSLKSSRNAFFACTDLGIYVGRGDGASIPEVNLASATERLVAPNSVSVLDDTLYGLFDGGFLSCDENGNTSETFAQPINAFVQEETRLLSALAKATVGWADEGRNLYICAIPAAINEQAATRQYVYSTRTKVWTTWAIPDVVSAVYVPTDINQDTSVETQARAILFCSSLPDEGDTAEGVVTSNILRRERVDGAASSFFRDADYTLTCPGAGYSQLLNVLPGGPTASQIATGSFPGFSNTQPGSTYCRRADGSLVLVAPGGIRVEPEGILTERGSSNYVKSSDQIGNADWNVQGTLPPTVTLNTTEVADPTGSFRATKAVYPSIAYNNWSWIWQLTGSGVNSMASVYMRMPPGQTGRIYLYGRQSANNWVECNVTDRWQRFKVPTGGYIVIGYQNDSNTLPGGAGGTFYLWQGQIEPNGLCSSPIITGSSVPVSRTADQISFSNPLNPSNPAAWSVGFKCTPQNTWRDMGSLAGAACVMFMSASGTFNVASGSFTNPTPAAEASDVSFQVTDGVNAKYSRAVGALGDLSGISPLTFLAMDSSGTLSTVPAGVIEGIGTGIQPGQASPIQLGQDGFGTGPVNGWFSDIKISQGVPTTSAVSQLVFSPASLIANVQPGDLFTQAWDGANAMTVVRVASVDYDTGTVTFVTPGRFTPGLTLNCYSSIPCTLAFLPLTLGEPLTEKAFVEVYVYMRQWDGDFCTAQLDSERRPVPLKTLTKNATGTVAFPPTGTGAVSSQRGEDVVLRFGTDINSALGARLGLTLKFQNAKTQFDLASFTVNAGDKSESPSR